MSKVCDREWRCCVGHIVDDLRAMDDGRERLEYLVEMAKDLPCLNAEFKRECFKVKGCLSSLWIVPEYRDGKCYFHCDGDAVIPKGVAFIIAAAHSGYTPEEILQRDPDQMCELGLETLLSPNRRNAVTRVPDTMREYARQFLEQLLSCSTLRQSLKWAF
jgi:cysteine desulfuration protein SufE